MSIQNVLIPHKHVRFSDSIIALAGFLRFLLVEAKTIDELWVEIGRSSNKWLGNPSFTHLILAIDVLYAIKQVEFVSEGRIRSRSS